MNKNAFLHGQNIYLRPLEASDLTESYQNWFNDADVCTYNSHHRFPYYKQNMEDYFESVIKHKDHLILGIFDTTTDMHIGNVSLQEIDKTSQNAEFAIIIGNKDFCGNGIGAEAGALIIGHGFDQLNMHRIYCGTSEENTPMQHLAKKLGFSQEGVSREELFKNGSYKDIFRYSILVHEYER